MRRVLNIEINAGETTCYAEPGAPCPWLRTQRWGTQYQCGLFDQRVLKDADGIPSGPGWLQRLPECVATEVKP